MLTEDNYLTAGTYLLWNLSIKSLADDMFQAKCFELKHTPFHVHRLPNNTEDLLRNGFVPQ